MQIELTIAKFYGALALQFLAAPHFVDFSHEEGGHSVRLQTGCNPAVGVVKAKSKSGGEDKLTVTVTVPNNGGLRGVFGVETSGDPESILIAKLIRAAIAGCKDAAGAKAEVTAL